MPAAGDFPNDERSRTLHEGLLVFCAALLVLSVVTYLQVTLGQPDVYHLGGGDAAEYDLMAKSLLRDHNFSNIMFGLRPPLTSLFYAAIYLLAGKEPYIGVFFNTVLGALSAVMTYKLAVRLLHRHGVAVLAGLLLAVDLAFLDANVSLMSEPLHNFLLLVGLYWFSAFLQNGRWQGLLITALALCLGMLVRPIMEYLAPVLAVAAVIYRRKLWPKAAVLVALCVIPVVGWSLRNLHYNDNFNFSMDGPFTLLFYKGVSVESHATGRDPNEVAIDIAMEVERRMGNTGITRADVADFPVGQDADRFTTSAARQRVITQMALEIYRKYPAWTLIISGGSLVRQFIPSTLPLPDWLQLAQIVPMLLLGAIGYLTAWREREWLFLLVGHATVLFYLGLPTLAHAGLYASRLRTPWLPIWMMCSALGVFALIRLARQKQSGQPA